MANILLYLFNTWTVYFIVVGGFFNFLDDYLPSLIVNSFMYGKVGRRREALVKTADVPKRWFRHFYVFATIYSSWILYLVLKRCIYEEHIPGFTYTYLDFFGGTSRQPTVEPAPLLLAAIFLCMQTWRRFYETWFVTIYSEAKMNIAYYIIGYVHYWGAITAILIEAKNFKANDGFTPFRLTQLSQLDLLATFVFLFAWCGQYQCAVILANMRKNKKGEVVTTAHNIPRGGLFEILSSPHFTCEVLVYASLAVILRQSSTFPYVLLFVFINQLEMSLLTHWWYKKTFKDYPERKKILIPFLF